MKDKTFGGGWRRSPCPPVLLALVVAAFFASWALAGTGTPYSGVTTMTFQNLVAPTSAYTGCEATYITTGIALADTGKNYGASTTLNLGSPMATNGEARILLKFDISALPDSAVIVRARVYLYQTGPLSNQASEPVIWRRSFNPWTEGTQNGVAEAPSADWNNRTGAAWNSAGAQVSGTGNTGRFWGPGATSTPDSVTLSGSFFGSDSANSSTNLSTFDTPFEAFAEGTWKNGTLDARRLGWVTYDWTHQVWLWHIGANDNNGAIGDISLALNVSTFTFQSDDGAWVHRNPKLIVEYIDPTVITGSSTASGSNRVVGGGRVGAVH